GPGNSNLFTNSGTVEKSSGSFPGTDVNIPFTNAGGSVRALAGTLVLQGLTGNCSGTLDAVAGAALGLAGTPTGALSGAPAGLVGLAGGTLQAGAAGLTLNFVGSGFGWTGSTLSGPVTNTGLLNIQTSDTDQPEAYGATLTNAGAVVQSGSDRFLFLNST